ncbi:MAG: sensor histidine kinase [Verrucomicrobiota bacterium]
MKGWRILLGKAGLYLLVWVVVLSVIVTQFAWGTERAWVPVSARILRDWGPWMGLGPLLWWFVKRFPLFGGRRSQNVQNLGIHLAGCLLMIVVAEVIVALVIHPLTRPLLHRETQVQLSANEGDSSVRQPRESRPRPRAKGGGARDRDYRWRSRNFVRKVPLWLLLYWVFALIVTAILQRMAVEEKARRALALQNDLVEARFRELQSRLNPHFLFNVLNSIAALIHVDPPKAEEMVTRLSSLLRRVLASSEQTLVPLAEELSLLRDYLDIERERFPDRLTILEEVEKESLLCLIPPLTLQPIAENAIKHGIEPKREPSQLWIQAKVRKERLAITIIDDGVGAGHGRTRQMGMGMGLQNVIDRLENVFPGKSQVVLDHPSEGGTVVEIMIPRTEGVLS